MLARSLERQSHRHRFCAADWAKCRAATGVSRIALDRGFRPGTTVYFPVSVQGAFFFLGDGHACQGDGEIVGTGIETSFEIEFSVRLLKGKWIGWPRGENADDIFTVGNARPLDQALQHATTEMLDWLERDHGLDATAASHLLGQAVRYEVANVFNPAYSVVCRLAKRWLTA